MQLHFWAWETIDTKFKPYSSSSTRHTIQNFEALTSVAYDVLGRHKIRRSTDYEALKLWKGRSDVFGILFFRDCTSKLSDERSLYVNFRTTTSGFNGFPPCWSGGGRGLPDARSKFQTIPTDQSREMRPQSSLTNYGSCSHWRRRGRKRNH